METSRGIEMDETKVRALLTEYLSGGSADVARAAKFYTEDAVLEFPQSGERFRGRDHIVAFRSAYPADVGFTIDRIIGRDDLWLTEVTVTYDNGERLKGVAVEHFRDGRIALERVYAGETWEPPDWRSQWVELMDPASDESIDSPAADRAEMDEAVARALIEEHFAWASKDEPRASELYADDVALEFPQSGERIRSRDNIIAFRSSYPAGLTFEMHRITGRGDLWVNEYTIRYDGGRPHNVAGIMEFRDGKVIRERIYIVEPWEAPAWRAHLVEMMAPAH